MGEIELAARLAPADLVRANLVLVRRQLLLVALAAALLAALVPRLLGAPSTGNEALVGAATALGALAGVALLAVHRARRQARAWRRRFPDGILYVLGDEGLLVRAGGKEERLRWSQIARATRTGRLLLLHLSARAAHVVPLPPEREDEVRALLAAKLGTRARLGRA